MNKLIYWVLFISIAVTSCQSDAKTSSENQGVTPPPQGIPQEVKEAIKTEIPTADVEAIPNSKVDAVPSQKPPMREANRQAVQVQSEASTKKPNTVKEVQLSTKDLSALTKESKQAIVDKARAEDDGFTANQRMAQARAKAAQAGADGLPPLPSTCGLVSQAFIETTIGVPAGKVTVKDGSAKSNNNQRACFFRWDHKGVPNSGVLVQLSRNPVPEELPDWASYYISTKRQNGDKTPDGSATYRYKDFPDMGVAGAYNYELARYYWRTEDDLVVGILFNIQASEAEHLVWARAIGQEVMKNLN